MHEGVSACVCACVFKLYCYMWWVYTVKPLQQTSQIQIKDRNVVIIYRPDSCIKADAILCTHFQLHGLPKALFHRSPCDSGAVQAKIPGESRSSICSGLVSAVCSHVLSCRCAKWSASCKFFPGFLAWSQAARKKGRNQTLRPLTPAEIKNCGSSPARIVALN